MDPGPTRHWILSEILQLALPGMPRVGTHSRQTMEELHRIRGKYISRYPFIFYESISQRARETSIDCIICL